MPHPDGCTVEALPSHPSILPLPSIDVLKLFFFFFSWTHQESRRSGNEALVLRWARQDLELWRKGNLVTAFNKDFHYQKIKSIKVQNNFSGQWDPGCLLQKIYWIQSKWGEPLLPEKGLENHRCWPDRGIQLEVTVGRKSPNITTGNQNSKRSTYSNSTPIITI